jgi:hypothetical protein
VPRLAGAGRLVSVTIFRLFSRQVSSESTMVDFVSRARAVFDAAVVGGVRPRYAAKIGAYFGSLNIWFWALVGLPTLIAGVYYFALASDLYLSEVKFVIHGPAKAPTSAISAMLASAASAVSDDTFAVHEYLMSRDVVRRLEREDDLRSLIGRPEGDLISRSRSTPRAASARCRSRHTARRTRSGWPARCSPLANSWSMRSTSAPGTMRSRSFSARSTAQSSTSPRSRAS